MIAIQKKSILLIDDGDECRGLTRELLSGLGYRCMEAEDGEKGLALATKDLPDLVLLDVRMPRMDGFETARLYRETISSRTPIVMLTALDDIDTRVRSIQAGANDVLTKPTERNLLRVRIETLLEQEVLYDKFAATQQVALALTKAMEAKSRFTSGHSQRTGLWAQKIGLELGLGEDRASILRIAGCLHDIGKIGVPDSLLEKPARLTDDEIAVMRTHPIIGELILKAGDADPIIIKCGRSHHERMDGRGYPDGVRGADLPIDVRIVTVADVFDAMTSRRPYQNPLAPVESVKLLKEAIDEGQLDGEVVRVIIDLVNSKRIYGAYC
ncbi:MAG: response regulator [Planctomycetes bacterium]|nr:response regulator [Planctomycetota bacterium]